LRRTTVCCTRIAVVAHNRVSGETEASLAVVAFSARIVVIATTVIGQEDATGIGFAGVVRAHVAVVADRRISRSAYAVDAGIVLRTRIAIVT